MNNSTTVKGKTSPVLPYEPGRAPKRGTKSTNIPLITKDQQIGKKINECSYRERK